MKKYVLILFCLLSSFARAQLQNDFARFAQTLQNLAAKLPAGIVKPPPFVPFFDKPAGIKLDVPSAGGKIEVEWGDEDKISIPPNSTVELIEEDNKNVPIITVAAEGKIEFPSPTLGGYVGVTKDSEVLLPGETIPIQLPAGKYIKIEKAEKGGVVTITPKSSIVPPPLIPPGGISVKVPAIGGDITLSTGEKITVPKGATVTEYPSGDVDITLSSDGSVTLSNGQVIKAPAGSTIKVTTSETAITIPAITNPVKVTVPSKTVIVASNAVTLKWPDGKTQNLTAAGEKMTIIPGSSLEVIPSIPEKPGIPEKPIEPLAPTKRDPKNVLKTVGNVIQLNTPVPVNTEEAKKEAQKISGYITVYYAFNELSRILNGKDLTLPFNQFLKPTALRSIKKRRIQVACRDYLANILIKPKNKLPTKTPFAGLKVERLQGIYRSLVSDLVSAEAQKFVADRYKNGTTVEQDSFEPSTFILQGQTLIKALKPVIERRRQYYIGELMKQNIKEDAAIAFVSNVLTQVAELQQYTNIRADITIKFDASHVLTELHKKEVFGLEEGYLSKDLLDGDGILEKKYINQAMPQGLWLHEGDIAHLVRDPIVQNAVGLPEDIKNMITVFNDLSLLKVPIETITTADEEIQGKYFINTQILERIVKDERNNIHIFIVNVGFYFGGSNRPDESRWVVIVRYPSDEYVIVDAKNDDVTKNVNLTIIKEEMAK